MIPDESDSGTRAEARRGLRSPATDSGVPPDPFALPAETPFRFALLVVAVFVSTTFTWNSLYLTFNGERWLGTYRSCGVSDPLPSDPPSAFNAATDRTKCMAAANQEIVPWILAGILLLLLVALVVYWMTPWWRVRRGQLEEPDAEEAADILAELDRLRDVAGVGRVAFLWQPLKAAPAAFAFGRPGHRKIALSGGLAVRFYRDRPAFRAVVLHELAHLRNRDVDQAYGAIAAWRAFLVTALLPFVAVELWRPGGLTLDAGWRFAVLALLVYLLRNAVLRSRELYADARVQSWGEGVPLFDVLGRMPAGGRYLGRWLAMHPTSALRQRALTDPAPLFRVGFWEAFGIGLLATVAIPQILLVADRLVGFYVSQSVVLSVLVVAFLAAPALVISVWRMRFPGAFPVKRPVWPLGIGFAVGSAVGLPLALSESAIPEAGPLSPSMLWLLLVSVVVLGPLPSWIAEGATSWLAPAIAGTRRRIAGLMAVTLISLVLVSLLSWLQAIYTAVMATGQATVYWRLIWQGIPIELSSGLTATPGLEEGIIASLVLALATHILVGQALAHSRNPHLMPSTEAGPRIIRPGRKDRRSPWPELLAGLTAGLLAVMLMLSMRLVAHANVSAQVRANWRFIMSFAEFQLGAIIVLAIVGGLLVTAATASVPLARGGLTTLIASLVATLGFVFQPTVGSCVPAMALNPTHPTHCPFFPGWSFVWQSIGARMGIAGLVILLLAPVVAAVAAFLRRRTLRRGDALACSAGRLRGMRIGSIIVAVAAIIPVSFAAVDASGKGLQDAGRITGPGYQFDLPPNWSNATQQLLPTTPGLLQAFRAEYIEAQMIVLVPPAPLDTASLHDLRGAGARPGTIDGAPTATFDSPASAGKRAQSTIVVHEQRRYMIQLICHPRDFSRCESDAQFILSSWHWR